MFPFDPLDGTAQTALMIPVVILLYAIILVKLHHTGEHRSQSDSLSSKTERYPSETKTVRNPSAANGVRKIEAKQQPPVIQIQKPPKQVPRENPQDNLVKAERAFMLDEEAQEKKKRKSFFLFGEKDFEGCHHKLGHLTTVAKNTPIPEECFGCPEILECLKAKPGK